MKVAENDKESKVEELKLKIRNCKETLCRKETMLKSKEDVIIENKGIDGQNKHEISNLQQKVNKLEDSLARKKDIKTLEFKTLETNLIKVKKENESKDLDLKRQNDLLKQQSVKAADSEQQIGALEKKSL